MKKVIAGLMLSMAGVGFSLPSMAASADTGAQTKGASGEAGVDAKTGREGSQSAKSLVKEADVAPKGKDGKEGRAALKEAHKKSSEEYKAAKEKCDEMKGNEKDVCVATARAARVRANAEAEASVMGTSSARRKAQVDMAKAEYGVAKAKCKAMEGDEKSKCMKEAKETRAKATLEPNTQKKAGTATHPMKQDPNQERAGTRPETSSEKK